MKMRLPFSLPCLSAAMLLTASVLTAEPPPEVEVTIQTRPAQMKYDTEQITAQPGAKVTLHLDNTDDLPHNLVVCQPLPKGNDKGMNVAMAAWNLGDAGMVKQWIPDHPRVIAYTKLVDPHQKDTITFTAPETEGEYPYVCTFPGHAMVMNGVLTVARPVAPIRNLHFRYYTGKFRILPDFSKLTPVTGGPLPAGKCDIALNKEKNHFAYEFEGYLDCAKDGEYTFVVASDDGVRLFIDGRAVLEDDGIHPLKFKEKRIKLTKGEHKFLAHYFDGGGGAQLFLAWKGPGFPETPLTEWVPNSDQRETDAQKYLGMPLVVGKEPLIYRNFVQGSGPRGIAVGYPGGVNLCWDADQMNLALVWQGAFMDAKRHWTGRGAGDQAPLGYDVARLGQIRSLALLESFTSPWVAPFKKDQLKDPAYRFLGYELDAKRHPSFRWQFQGITVEESFQPEGESKAMTARLERVITLTPPPAGAPSGLWFMALSGPVMESRGSFLFDKLVRVTVSGSSTPQVRGQEGRTEVLVPVTFTEGTATIKMTYAWNTEKKLP